MSKRMTDREYEIMLMLRKDTDEFRTGRSHHKIHQEDDHKFMSDIKSEIVGTHEDMPEWAKKDIAAHRGLPGETKVSTGHQLLTDKEIAEIKARRAKFNAKKVKKASKGAVLK